MSKTKQVALMPRFNCTFSSGVRLFCDNLCPLMVLTHLAPFSFSSDNTGCGSKALLMRLVLWQCVVGVVLAKSTADLVH